MFKLVEELLVVIKFEFGDLVHETFNVSHTKQLADKWTSLELFQIVNVLPRTDEGDWTLSGSNSEREREGGEVTHTTSHSHIHAHTIDAGSLTH